MTPDLLCDDELDPMGREVGPVQALAQDLYHWLGTVPGTLVLDPDWGLGIQRFLSRPFPTTFADDTREKALRDFADRIAALRVVVQPTDGGRGKRIEIQAEPDGAFLRAAGVITVAVVLDASGLRRLA